MATGDIKNNLRKLKNELKLIQYSNEVDFEKMMIGLSAPFLPILHYVFNEFSHELTSYFSKKGHDLYAKSDFRFLEIIYKILITEFDTKPMLTKQQFFSIGFPEIKVIFATKIISLCREKHDSLVKKSGKKKKKITKTSQSHHDRIKIDDTQRSESLLPIQVNANDANTTDSVCILPENLPQTGHQAMRPKPIPELALSPVKAVNHVSQGIDDTEEVDVPQVSASHFDSQLLDLTDLTDVGEESFIETGGIEIIDNVDDDKAAATGLPQFKITRHTPQRGNVKVNKAAATVKVNSNYLPIVRDLTTGTNFGHAELFSGHSLPCNIPLATSKLSNVNTPSEGVAACNQCTINLSMIETLQQKMENMEKDISNLVSVNNDLSAKVILLETKLKIMGSRGHTTETQSDVEYPVHSDADDYGNSDLNEEEEAQNDSFSPNEHLSTSKITDDTKYIIQEKSYSPIKYTDDDIIIKDFKPMRMKDVYSMMSDVRLDEDKEMRMKDVYSMMNEVRLDEDKENDDGVPRKATNIKTRKEPLALKIVMDEDDSDNILSTDVDDFQQCPVDDLFTDSCNVSQLEDTVAEQAVCNVRKRLQETKDMLRKSGNYLIK